MTTTLQTGLVEITITQTEASRFYSASGTWVRLREQGGRILGQVFPVVGYNRALGAFATWAAAENAAIVELSGQDQIERGA